MKLLLFFILLTNLYSNQVYQKTIDVLQNLKQTKYRHYREDFIISKHKMYIDCSGFVNYIINSINPNLYKKMLQKSKYSPNRVLAADYADFFKNHTFKEFKIILSVKEIQKGDIIAYKLPNIFIPKKIKNKIIYLTKCLKYKKHKCILRKNTGHVFIALDKPKKYKNKWILKIADSTNHLHFTDNRTHGGIGWGYIFLYDNYIKIHNKKIPIYIGRLEN